MNTILEHYLFDAFSNASDNIFVYVTDIKQDLTRWSKQSVDYFGLESEYIKNCANVWLEFIHPDDREIYLKDITAVFSGESSQHNCQYRVRNRYGSYVWVECKGSVLANESGELTVFAGIMTRLDNQMKYDNLTHLMNSYHLQQQDFSGINGCISVIGIDNFRAINSQHGLLYGNKVLIHLSEMLVKYSLKGSTICRLQGDDFVVISPDTTPEEQRAVFSQLRKACGESNSEKGIASFSVSAGIVELNDNADDFATLISKADLALSYAKNSTSSHSAIYSADIEAKQNRRNRIAEALIRSIKNDFSGFELYYQPIVSNANDYIVGCESLLRWDPKDPEIGACYPSEFIPILEDNGFIIQVGYFVMTEAIRQASEWQAKGYDINVSFNVSYLQLEDELFIPALLAAANNYKVNTSKIIIELTESIFAADTILIKNAFAELHSNGFKIALDDFGTGHSSFWMLHNLDVDIIKIDQAFIRGLIENDNKTDYIIVESVAYMCSRSNYLTVAEGVENQEVWDKINEFNFSGLQGYHFSKPVPVEKFEEFLLQYRKCS